MQKPITLEIKNENGGFSLLAKVVDVDYFRPELCAGDKHDLIFQSIVEPNRVIVECRKCGLTGSFEIIGVRGD